MNVREEAEKLKSKGYNEDDANARICQDIILKGIAASGLSRSVTVNGERGIPGRPKVVRGSNVPVLTSHAGLNPVRSLVTSRNGELPKAGS